MEVKTPSRSLPADEVIPSPVTRSQLALPSSPRHSLFFTIRTPRDRLGLGSAREGTCRLSVWSAERDRLADDVIIDLAAEGVRHDSLKLDLATTMGGCADDDGRLGGPILVLLELIRPATGRAYRSSHVWLLPSDPIALEGCGGLTCRREGTATFAEKGHAVDDDSDGAACRLALKSIVQKLSLIREVMAHLAKDAPPGHRDDDDEEDLLLLLPLAARRRRRDLLHKLERQIKLVKKETERVNLWVLEGETSLCITMPRAADEVLPAGSDHVLALCVEHTVCNGFDSPLRAAVGRGGVPPPTCAKLWPGPRLHPSELHTCHHQHLTSTGDGDGAKAALSSDGGGRCCRRTLYMTVHEADVRVGGASSSGMGSSLEAFGLVVVGRAAAEHGGGGGGRMQHLGCLPRTGGGGRGEGGVYSVEGKGPAVMQRAWRMLDLQGSRPSSKVVIVFVRSDVVMQAEKDSKKRREEWFPDGSQIVALASMPVYRQADQQEEEGEGGDDDGDFQQQASRLLADGVYRLSVVAAHKPSVKVGFVRVHCRVTTAEPQYGVRDESLRDFVSPRFADEDILETLFPVSDDDCDGDDGGGGGGDGHPRPPSPSEMLLSSPAPMDLLHLAPRFLHRLATLLKYRVIGDGGDGGRHHSNTSSSDITTPLLDLATQSLAIMLAESVGVDDHLLASLEDAAFRSFRTEGLTTLLRHHAATAPQARAFEDLRVRCFILRTCLHRTVEARVQNRQRPAAGHINTTSSGHHSDRIARGDLLSWAGDTVALLEQLGRAFDPNRRPPPSPNHHHQGHGYLAILVSALSLIYPSCLLVLPPAEVAHHLHVILRHVSLLTGSDVDSDDTDSVLTFFTYLLASPSQQSRPLSPPLHMEAQVLLGHHHHHQHAPPLLLLLHVALPFLAHTFRALPRHRIPLLASLPPFLDACARGLLLTSPATRLSSDTAEEVLPPQAAAAATTITASTVSVPPPPPPPSFGPPGKRAMQALSPPVTSAATATTRPAASPQVQQHGDPPQLGRSSSTRKEVPGEARCLDNTQRHFTGKQGTAAAAAAAAKREGGDNEGEVTDRERRRQQAAAYIRSCIYILERLGDVRRTLGVSCLTGMWAVCRGVLRGCVEAGGYCWGMEVALEGLHVVWKTVALGLGSSSKSRGSGGRGEAPHWSTSVLPPGTSTATAALKEDTAMLMEAAGLVIGSAWKGGSGPTTETREVPPACSTTSSSSVLVQLCIQVMEVHHILLLGSPPTTTTTTSLSQLLASTTSRLLASTSPPGRHGDDPSSSPVSDDHHPGPNIDVHDTALRLLRLLSTTTTTASPPRTRIRPTTTTSSSGISQTASSTSNTPPALASPAANLILSVLHLLALEAVYEAPIQIAGSTMVMMTSLSVRGLVRHWLLLAAIRRTAAPPPQHGNHHHHHGHPVISFLNNLEAALSPPLLTIGNSPSPPSPSTTTTPLGEANTTKLLLDHFLHHLGAVVQDPAAGLWQGNPDLAKGGRSRQQHQWRWLKHVQRTCRQILSDLQAARSSLSVLEGCVSIGEEEEGTGRKRPGVERFLVLAVCRDVLAYVWRDVAPDVARSLTGQLEGLLLQPAAGMDSYAGGDEQQLQSRRQEAMPFLSHAMALRLAAHAVSAAVQQQHHHRPDQYYNYYQAWFNDQCQVLACLQGESRQGVLTDAAASLALEASSLLRADLTTNNDSSSVLTARREQLRGMVGATKKAGDEGDNTTTTSSPPSYSSYYGIRFLNHPWFAKGEGKGAEEGTWLVMKLAATDSPRSLLALGTGSGTRLLELLKKWRKEVPGTMLLLPGDPWPSSVDMEGPIIQVVSLLPMGTSDMIERLCDEDVPVTSSSLDWHSELASINQSPRASSSPSDFYTFVVRGPAATLHEVGGKRPSEGSERVGGSTMGHHHDHHMADLHPSVSGSVDVLHLTITSFSGSNSSRGVGGAATGPSQQQQQPLLQPFLSALSTSLSCMEWPTPAALVHKARLHTGLDAAVASSNLLMNQAVMLKKARRLFITALQHHHHHQQQQQHDHQDDPLPPAPTQASTNTSTTYQNGERQQASLASQKALCVCRMDMEAAIEAMLNQAMRPPVGLHCTLSLLHDDKARRGEALRKKRKELKQAYLREKKANEQAGLPPPPPVDTAALEAAMVTDPPKRFRTLQQVRDLVCQEVTHSLEVLRGSSENVRDKQVCLWLEALWYSQSDGAMV